MTDRLRWMSFPRSQQVTLLGREVIQAFEDIHTRISSDQHDLSSNQVLAIACPGLQALGFEVETGKKRVDKISVPVLFGENGRFEKSFDADAWHRQEGFVIEVEAGRAVDNNQFLKDIVQASVMAGVDHLAVMCRNRYRRRDDFKTITHFLETVFVSGRIVFPMKTILIVGY